MTALEVSGLTKQYPAFLLDKVSFTVGQGRIVGLVGANGAGKSTTIKGIMRLIQTQGGVTVFGLPAAENERKVKGLTGYVGGGFRYYPQRTVARIASAVAPFYEGWKEECFLSHLKTFGIAPEKKIAELSEGMKVKFCLALALSHGARLLVLDEPTSGLDPLSREDLCDTLLDLVKGEGVSVLFSTHITSDLEKIADDVVMLSHGKVVTAQPLSELKNAYCLARYGSPEEAKASGAIGVKTVKEGYAGLVPRERAGKDDRAASIEEIVVHLECEAAGRIS